MSSFDSEKSTEGEEITNAGIESESILVTAIADVLNKIIAQHKKDKRYYNRIVRRQKRMAFSLPTKPEISLFDYLNRIISYSKLEESTLIIALIYIDRVCKSNHIILTDCNVYRMLFTSLIIAIKYNEDQYYEAEYYAKIGGITKEELIQLEYEFLFLSDFILFVTKDDYEKYKLYLSNLNEVTFKEAREEYVNEICNIEV